MLSVISNLFLNFGSGTGSEAFSDMVYGRTKHLAHRSFNIAKNKVDAYTATGMEINIFLIPVG